ncbi:MAG: hypothetical protein JNL82_26385 [Myxococcales bacterium]|nr:hypothetical protein [Myxococcales bacterium]
MARVLPFSLVLGAGLVALGGCQFQTKHHLGKVPPERPVAAAAPAPRPTPQGTFEGSAEGSLLDNYVDRRERPEGPKDPKDTTEYTPRVEDLQTFTLPTNSKKMVTTLLTFAAQDNRARALDLFTEQARWGVPDRREPDARAIHEDGGQAFFEALRTVAARFEKNENLSCPPIMPAATVYVRNGAEPMWCFYISNDNFDILAFKLVHEGGAAKIDYVGMHEERPQGMIQRPGAIPPPMTPNLRRSSRLPPNVERSDPAMLQPGQTLDPDGLPPRPIVVPGAPPISPPDAAPGTNPAQPVATPPGQPAQPVTPPTKAETPAKAPAKAPAKPEAPTKAEPPAAPAEAPPSP